MFLSRGQAAALRDNLGEETIMARSHRKRREWKKIASIMENADLEIERLQIRADEYLCISGLYGRRQKDPTARKVLCNSESKKKTAI